MVGALALLAPTVAMAQVNPGAVVAPVTSSEISRGTAAGSSQSPAAPAKPVPPPPSSSQTPAPPPAVSR